VLNDYRITELDVALPSVLDCRDPSVLGVTLDALLAEGNYSLTQRLGAAALAREVEGLIAPSATRLGDTLVLFPPRLRGRSQLAVVAYLEPRLYVARTE